MDNAKKKKKKTKKKKKQGKTSIKKHKTRLLTGYRNHEN